MGIFIAYMVFTYIEKDRQLSSLSDIEIIINIELYFKAEDTDILYTVY